MLRKGDQPMSQYGEVPLGLGMHLVQNPGAMRYFNSLPSTEQHRIIELTHSIDSPSDMRRFVQDLASMGSDAF